METAFSLGSNLGDRFAALVRARDALGAVPGMRLLASSPVYETDPVGVAPEHRDKPFLNAVVLLEGEAHTDVRTVARSARGIEDALGRRRDPQDRYAPRAIDIDMLYWGDLVLQTPELILPHPECLNRRFVCAPLADLRPALRLPGVAHPVKDILEQLPEHPAVRRWPQAWPPPEPTTLPTSS